MRPDLWDTYEIVMDLGWPTFAPGAWWKFALSAALLVVALFSVLRIALLARKADKGRYSQLAYAAVTGISLASMVPLLMTVHQTTSEHRREVQMKAITERTGYRFSFGAESFPSGELFQNESVIVQRDRISQICSLSTWRKHRWTGEWLPRPTHWWEETNTAKILLICPKS
ncbi:hypothetical protein IU500_35825 [Nocardia terpenica]|uniref:hypothetical protein n=1 Tax=Nocardia terpenica TaxID=455432 RepID=UPI0018943D96|nr:hypothetical protein [Nocardia terpenica]MBF6063606.1 hypothetical protein [Nocardia terpenica]MBF6109385.1 hypothetical protein [Nocardia terpenica]MBF6114155.1 hypothetical protein [Nocardia terpenica]MBF6123825.1 hypothetical protein [Nocardia terpenica]MBF6157130.1 hypothetical protein [Nocardia terpenica]